MTAVASDDLKLIDERLEELRRKTGTDRAPRPATKPRKPPTVIDDQAVVADVEQLYAFEQMLEQSQRQLEGIREQREQLRAKLIGKLRSGVDYRAGHVRIRRVRSKPCPGIDAYQAIADGVLELDPLLPYLQPRRPRDTWTVAAA